MKHIQFSILLLTIFTTNTLYAKDCKSTDNPAEKLACYEKLVNCNNLQNKYKRLICFDGVFVIAAKAKETIGPVEKVNEEVVTRGPVKKTATSDFGKPEKMDPKEFEFIEATIVGVNQDPYKIDYLRLDNGQLWREKLEGRKRFKVGQKVRIVKGIFGSFNLTIEGQRGITKVKRLK